MHYLMKWPFKVAVILFVFLLARLVIDFEDDQCEQDYQVQSAPSFNKVHQNRNKKVRGKVQKQKNYTRCKIRRIGCFITLKNKFVLSDHIRRSTTETLKNCAVLCAKKNFRYVALEMGKICYCGKSVTFTYISTQGLFLTTSANACVAVNRIDVYRISKCTAKVKDDIAQLTIGCYPVQLKAETSWKKLKDTGNASSCLSDCEHLEFLLAAYGNNKSCFCTNPTLRSRYPEKNMSVEAELCSNDSLTHSLIMRTYAEDKRCAAPKFLQRMSSIVGLVSFPGSGNSWVRHLLECASGYYTGSIYYSSLMYEEGQLGEMLHWMSRRTFVIKSHKEALKHAKKFDKVILLIRNPFDAMVAEFNRVHGGKTGHASQAEFLSDEWIDFIPGKIQKWTDTVHNFIAAGIPLLIVYYEDLLVDAVSELRRMLQFINVEIKDLEQRLLCTEGDLSGNFRRHKVKQVSSYPFPMIDKINKHIHNASNLLKSHNFKTLLDYEQHFNIS